MSQPALRPDAGRRRDFLAWLWTSARPFVGWALAAAGAIALFVGWFGVSGESLTAKQLPYLVSAGLTGVALFILAGVFLATDDVRRQFARIAELERKVDDLYSLFVTELGPSEPASSAPVTPKPRSGDMIALPSGSSYHRADCALVAGKDEAAAVSAADVASRGLRPCRVCDPDAGRVPAATR